MGEIEYRAESMWMWLRADRTFGHRAIADLGLPGVVLPMGRVDRGLGAITAADMKPAQPQRVRTPRAGPECPTD